MSITDDDLKEPRSPERLNDLRRLSVAYLRRLKKMNDGEPDHELDVYPPEHPALDRLKDPEFTFTCDGCDHAPVCAYVFDPYNTDGDCLATK